MSEKQCVICKELILQDREKWVRLTDFDCGVEGGEVYNHLEFWQERFQITNSERKQKMYKQMGNFLQNIKNNIGNGGMLAQ